MIAPWKWGYFDQTILMQMKQPLKAFLLFPGSITILVILYPGPRHCQARSQPGYILNRKLETKNTRRLYKKSDYTYKIHFKYDQSVYREDKGDLML